MKCTIHKWGDLFFLGGFLKIHICKKLSWLEIPQEWLSGESGWIMWHCNQLAKSKVTTGGWVGGGCTNYPECTSFLTSHWPQHLSTLSINSTHRSNLCRTGEKKLPHFMTFTNLFSIYHSHIPSLADHVGGVEIRLGFLLMPRKIAFILINSENISKVSGDSISPLWTVPLLEFMQILLHKFHHIRICPPCH